MPTTTNEADRVVADTNILLRFSNKLDAQHSLVAGDMADLERAGYTICYTPQTLRELWNVLTRPAQSNGLGYSITEAESVAVGVEKLFHLLHDTSAMHDEGRRLVVRHEVKGIQVHDARLAASAIAGGCRAILSLNDNDFKRFGIEALHPRDVPAFLQSPLVS